MTRFKELKWEYNEYRTSLIAKVKILNNEYLAFQLTNIDTDDVILIDGQKMPEDDKYYNHVGTVKKGKEMFSGSGAGYILVCCPLRLCPQRLPELQDL